MYLRRFIFFPSPVSSSFALISFIQHSLFVFFLFSFFTDSLHSHLFSFHFPSFYPTLLSLCYSLPFLFLPSFVPFSFSLIPRPLSFVVLPPHTIFSRYSPGFICFPWSTSFVASHKLPFSSAISSDFFPSSPVSFLLLSFLVHSFRIFGRPVYTRFIIFYRCYRVCFAASATFSDSSLSSPTEASFLLSFVSTYF